MSKYRTTPEPTTRMPSGIPFIVGNEAAERFSFYGMKAILTVFMTKYLADVAAGSVGGNMDEPTAKFWVHNFVTAAYFFPIVGAIISDWLLGKYLTIMILSMGYCIGHGILALMDAPVGIDARDLLWWGLALIAVGAGGIKPCVSAHVGDQFGRQNEHLISRVFGWFYFAINFGSTISTILTPILLRKFGPGWAFGVPGILMALATLTFWLGRYRYAHIPPARDRFFEETFSPDGKRAMLNLIPLYVFVAMFWALFDQTASAWVLQAEHMDRVVFNVEILPDQFQAVNPILVMIFIPIFTYGVYPLLGKFFEVTPLRKVGMGLFLTIPAFAIPAWIENRISEGATPHIAWQGLAYVLMTAAEILVSITTLEFSYTQAPKKMKSFIMGLYFLSVALGNQFTAWVNKYISTQREASTDGTGASWLEGANYYWFFTAAMAVTAVLYVAFAQFYRGQTFVQDEGDAVAGADGRDAIAQAPPVDRRRD